MFGVIYTLYRWPTVLSRKGKYICSRCGRLASDVRLIILCVLEQVNNILQSYCFYAPLRSTIYCYSDETSIKTCIVHTTKLLGTNAPFFKTVSFYYHRFRIKCNIWLLQWLIFASVAYICWEYSPLDTYVCMCIYEELGWNGTVQIDILQLSFSNLDKRPLRCIILARSPIIKSDRADERKCVFLHSVVKMIFHLS